MNTEELKTIASQLGKPSGEDGIKTADSMHINNGGMIQRTIDLLGCREGDAVLEIGPGNGGYAPYVLSRAPGLRYYGIDISETMVQQAMQRNAALVKAGTASFTLGNGQELPYEDAFFDKVFTVNTLYFWEEPLRQLQEIRRVLKPQGRLSIGIRTRAFMEKLPFTQYGFRLYDADAATTLLEKAGYTVRDTVLEKEESMSIMGMVLEKERVVIVAEK
ncbi:class I SAM-dependent methyltransferase [Chitinophaga japonensis]|uniref:Methyltransferase family protein n=1 Tax=Chitinophaga japonensis TaxID=104662 RepID=A0A562SSH8_CHIJA|nr:class I SAM-dependent methyltransferase [Chitinophaga japonensis]TWI84201.1 methyltransferase family protein [Chitinophaga japonensis]